MQIRCPQRSQSPADGLRSALAKGATKVIIPAPLKKLRARSSKLQGPEQRRAALALRRWGNNTRAASVFLSWTDDDQTDRLQAVITTGPPFAFPDGEGPHDLTNLSCHRSAQVPELQQSHASRDRRAEPSSRTERHRNANVCMRQMREHGHANGALGLVVQMVGPRQKVCRALHSVG
jgi:hypothetical protein